MAITVAIELNREIELAASSDEVFALLSDIPRSATHYPKVDKLVDLGGGVYRWEMGKIGIDKYSIETVYACRYTADKAAGTITWEPVSGEGSGAVRGSWVLTPVSDQLTRARFQNTAGLIVPLPEMLKLVISPVVKHEFNSLVDTYMNNLRNLY